MTYREHPPHPVLAPYIACYWSLRGRAAPREERDRAVLPDACMDILFDLTASVSGSTASRVIGTMTRPLLVRDAGVLDLLGVRFRPGGAPPFVPLPAFEITDDALSLEHLWGPGATEMTERLREADTREARLRLLDQALIVRLAKGRNAGDPLVLAAAALAEEARGTLTIRSLAAAAGLGRRQLERRFMAAVGVSPKTVCRVIRFQNALSRLRARPHHDLSRVALDAGYHDQAHFTREFGSLAGIPPGAYRRRHGRALAERDASVQDGGRIAP